MACLSFSYPAHITLACVYARAIFYAEIRLYARAYQLNRKENFRIKKEIQKYPQKFF